MKELKVIDDQLPEKVVDTEMDMKSENPGKFDVALSKATEVKEKVEASKVGEAGYSALEQLKETKDVAETIVSATARRIHKNRRALIEDNYDVSGRDLFSEIPETQEGAEFPEFGTPAYIEARYSDALSGLNKAESLHRSNKYRRIWTAIVFLFFGGLFGASTAIIGKYAPFLQEAMQNIQAITLFAFFVICSAAALGFEKAPFARVYMPKRLIHDRQIKSIRSIINRTLVNDYVDDDTPADLRNRYRNGVTDSEGRPVEGQLLTSDIQNPTYYKKLNETVVAGLAIAVSCMFVGTHSASALVSGQTVYAVAFGAMGMEQGISQIISLAILAGGAALGMFVTGAAILSAWAFASPMAKRDVEAREVVARSSIAVMNDEKGNGSFKAIEEAKRAQVENAKKDDSTFIEYGKSTGIMHERRSPYSPNEAGMPVGLTTNDMSTHFLILGTTGSGKTSSGIRPGVDQFREADEELGMVVMDGKGPLPIELDDGSENYTLIHPDHTPVNPIENLDADETSMSFYELAIRGVTGDTFWQDAAFMMLRNHALINEVLERPWTLKSIRELIAMDGDDFKKLLKPYQDKWNAEGTEISEIHQQAITYRIYDLVYMKEDTPKQYGSIVEITKQWIGQIISHKRLAEWGNIEHGAVIEEACEGKHFGIAMPTSEFGPAGNLVSILLKKRLYKIIKNRGDVWKDVEGQTPVILVADEVQNLLTTDETDMMPIARSLGLKCKFATQNIDGIYAVLRDPYLAKQFLGNFGSVMAFKVTTDLTKEFVASKGGYAYKAKVTDMEGIVDARYENNAIINDPTRLPRKEGGMRWEETQSAGFVRSITSKITPVVEEMHKLVVPHHSAYQQKMNINVGQQKLIDEDELEMILQKPNMAFISVTRGRVTYCDFVDTTPRYN